MAHFQAGRRATVACYLPSRTLAPPPPQRRSYSTAGVWLLLVLASHCTPAISQSSSSAGHVTLYITDFGINQWTEELRLGDDFSHAKHQVFPDLPPAAQILIPMPPDERFAVMSHEELLREISAAVSERVGKAMEVGIDTFEVQLVQNINTAGYFSEDRQQAVDRFGAAAYGAPALVGTALKDQGYEVTGYAIVGSNGAKVLANNVEVCKGFLNGVDFFDGRAYLTPMARTIETLGEANVRFFNTKADWPAPYTPVGFRSIGNFDTVQNLKARYPRVSTFLLAPLREPRPFGSGHVAGMLDPDGDFALVNCIGAATVSAAPGCTVKGRDLRPFGPGLSGHPAPPPAQPSPFLDRLQTSLEVLNQVVGALEWTLGESILPQPLEDSLSLLPAILDDAKATGRSSFHPLVSHTLEELGRLGLSKLPGLVEKLREAGRLPPSFKLPPTLFGVDEFVAGFSSQMGRGKMGIEEATHYLDGVSRMTAAIAGGLLGGGAGAEAGEGAASLAISILRGLTLRDFQSVANIPTRQRMLERWLTLQERRLVDGQPIQSFEEMFKPELLQEAGFEPATIYRFSLSTAWARETLAAAARGLGGVDITVEPRSKPEELDEQRRRVLEGRPARDSLSWDPDEPPKPPDADDADGSDGRMETGASR